MPVAQYSNLPGVVLDLRDGGLRATPAPMPPTTDSLTILGTAVDGPYMTPVRVSSIDNAVNLFGSYVRSDGRTPNGATLILGLKQAFGAGARNVYLMRINGRYAQKTLTVTFAANTDYVVTLGGTGQADTLARTATSRIPDGATVTVVYSDNSTEQVTLNGTQATNLARDIAAVSDVTAVRMDALRLRGRYPGASYNGVDYLVGFNGLFLWGRSVSTVTYAPTDYTVTVNADPAKDTLARTSSSNIPDGSTVLVFYSDGTTEEVKLVGTNSTSLTKNISATSEVVAVRAKPSGTFPRATYTSLNALVNAVNATAADHDASMELLDLRLANLATDLLTGITSASALETALTGGDDELSLPVGSYGDAEHVSLRGQLKVAYRAIEQFFPTSLIVPKVDGIWVDFWGNVNNIDARELAQVCHQMAVLTQFEVTPIGFLPVAPLTGSIDSNRIQSWINAFTDPGNALDFTDDGVDLGRYLSIVFGEPIFNDDVLGLYADTGAAAYAGLVSSLPPNRAPINRTIPGIVRMRFSVNLQQADALLGARYVVLNQRTDLGPYVVDSPTAAKPDSDYRRLTTVRIAQAVATRVRQIVLPFLGEPMDVPAFTTLNANLRQMAEDLQAAGFVRDLTFTVLPDARNPNLLNVDVVMVPVFEIKRVKVTVSMRLPQPAAQTA